MLEKLRKRSAGEEGFTLVELLVVMLILGILAAIAIPSFFAQRDKATDAEAKANAKTAQTAIETFATENSAGSYAGATAANLETIEGTLEAAKISLLPAPTANTYSVGYESDRTGTQLFTISRASNGDTTQTCTAGAGGGCSSTGTW